MLWQIWFHRSLFGDYPVQDVLPNIPSHSRVRKSASGTASLVRPRTPCATANTACADLAMSRATEPTDARAFVALVLCSYL
jgi:hypothetical protein